MLRKTVSGITLTLMLIGILTSAFNVQPVKASGTIYIKPGVLVDPLLCQLRALAMFLEEGLGNN